MPKGGKRAGAGRKKVKPEAENLPLPNKNLATEILASLAIPDYKWKKQHPDISLGEPCHCEICLWRREAKNEGAEGRYAREYLWNRRDGRPVQTVNHLHDKPIEMNVNLSMSEVVRKVRQRKAEYERKSKA